MTFVFPLLLGGLALAGLPVLLHFLIRKKPKTLVFPAFRFLMQKQRSNTRNLRLRHLLLLLLRIALIALICSALARPRLIQEQIGISRERPVALALVFDTTPSMEYKSGDQTRLDLAKKRALELLDQLPEDCRVLVLDAADPASFGREDWHKSLEKARQRIQSLTIRPESVPVTKALDEALRRFETFDDAEAQRMPRFVCIFSDRTKPSWQFDPSAKRGAEVQTLYFDVGIDDPIDLAIVSADIPKQSFVEGETIPLTVVVKATGQNLEKKSNLLIVKIDAGAKKDPTQIVNFEADKPQTLALEIPGDLRPGWHQAEIRFETVNDALSFNNKRYVTFKVLERPRVLVLADDLKRTDRFAAVLESLRYAVEHKTLADKWNLDDQEAVFLVGLQAPTDDLWKKLAAYVDSGRGVCIIPAGEKMDLATYESEAAKKVMPAKFVAVIDSGQRCKWKFWEADLGHPFLSFYRRWLAADFRVVTNPQTASKFWKVALNDRCKSIIDYDVGVDQHAVVERPPSKKSGKVLLLTTPMDEQPKAWHNYDENLNSFYLALTLFCARYLCTDPESETYNYQFGQQPTVRKPEPFPKYSLTSGDFAEDILFDSNGLWTTDRLPKAGNYMIEGVNPETSDRKALHGFSINIASEESDLTRISADEIEAALGKDALVPLDRRRSITDTMNWDEPIDLFPWLMIALLFLLALENLLANKFYRQETEPLAA